MTAHVIDPKVYITPCLTKLSCVKREYNGTHYFSSFWLILKQTNSLTCHPIYFVQKHVSRSIGLTFEQ